MCLAACMYAYTCRTRALVSLRYCHATAITPQHCILCQQFVLTDWWRRRVWGISQCWRWNRLPPHDLTLNQGEPPLASWEMALQGCTQISPRETWDSRVQHVSAWCKRVQNHPGTHLMQSAERAIHYCEVEGGRLLARGCQLQDPPQTWLHHVHEAALRREWE